MDRDLPAVAARRLGTAVIHIDEVVACRLEPAIHHGLGGAKHESRVRCRS